jgi:phage FluMu protein Com
MIECPHCGEINDDYDELDMDIKRGSGYINGWQEFWTEVTIACAHCGELITVTETSL